MEKEFLESGGEWQELLIGDIFNINTPKKKFDANKISFGGEYPYVARGDKNNGIRGYITEDIKYLNSGNTISFGQDTATMFYQENAYFTGDKIKVFSLKNGKLNKLNSQFLISAMKKSFGLFSWGSSSFSEENLKQAKIQLPILNNGVAFEYMENYMRELQKERLRELQLYLKVTNLSSYELTDDEINVIGGGKNTSLFEISDVLQWVDNIKEIDPLKLRQLSMASKYKYPFYGQSVINNGIIGFYSLTEKVLNNKNAKPTILIHSNNQNTVYLDTPFYLKDGHGATSVLQSEYLNRYTAFYLMTSIKKVILQKFNYDAKATKIGLKHSVIELPVNEYNQPDYDYMATYIRAIQKLIIKDLVLYTERELKAYEQVMSN